MPFEPIAIVGRSCIFPGALSPEALWSNVLERRSAITPPPEGSWTLPHALARNADEAYSERAWSDAGGYVNGFDPEPALQGLQLPAEQLCGLDPVFSWTIHGVREALRPLGHEGKSDRIGLILGNLSFPTPSMARYAHSVWLDALGPTFLGGRARELVGLTRPRPENRFMSGLPAMLAGQALGLGGRTLALDAACASSLYAIKLACDCLHDGQADVMVAGAVNAADRVFLHVGFSALSALSRSGQSRPFHKEADGLVPAEGAAFLALKRLRDAEVAGDRILGVVRAVGLSNDGRGRGLLVPSEEGQLRAMSRAYAEADLSPREVSVIECHATGTPVGDATEVRSMARMFEGLRELPIGSVKGNLGHPITAAGMAGVLKLIAAMEAGVLPPMRPVEAPLDVLASSPFRLIASAEPWSSDRPRRAAVNAFGFGGNNAHLLLEQWTERSARSTVAPAAPPRCPVAVVGLCALVGDDASHADFEAQLFARGSGTTTRSLVSVALEGLRFPPTDMQHTLPAQLLMLEAARSAVAGISLPREQTGVLIGMGTDPEIARYGARWQLASWSEAWAAALGVSANADWLREAQPGVHPPLDAAGVLGTMPNVFANRIDSQLDLAGASMSVSAEELSGVAALELALRALRAGELDAALVGAVDFSDELVHRSALAELGLHEGVAADAAVVLVLKRLADAEQAGERVLAVFDDVDPEVRFGDRSEAANLLSKRGHAHAASGLLHVAAAVAAVQHGARPGADGGFLAWFGLRAGQVCVGSMRGQTASLSLRGAGHAEPIQTDDAWQIQVFSGSDRAQVLTALTQGHVGHDGRARLVIVAASDEQLNLRKREALRYLKRGGPLPDGVAFAEAPVSGELAFVFTGAAAAYPGMASDLLLALPELAEPFWRKLAGAPAAIDSLHRGFSEPQHPLDQLWSSSLVCQAHARLSRHVLGIQPHAVIGYSSGESNAMFALDAWRDLDAMILESMASPIFLTDLTGEFRALQRAWGKLGHAGQARFDAYAIAAPVEEVRRALSGEPLAHLTIINSPHDCVIGGEPAACERVLDRLGRGRAIPIRYDLAAHCPEIAEVEGAWFDLHQRQTWDVAGVRFYWNGSGLPRAPSAAEVAREITQQAVQTLDFPRVIERAYRDGVRIFLEHGPRGLCSGWIDAILGNRPHLALPFDVAGRSSIHQALNATAALIAAGVEVDQQALLARLGPPRAAPAPRGPVVNLSAHAADIRLPRLPGDVQRLPRAPELPCVLNEPEAEQQPAARSTAPRGTRIDSPSVLASSQTDAPGAEIVPLPVVTNVEPLQPPLQALPLAAAAPAPTALSRALEIQAGIGEVHREFLAQQAEAQHRLLGLQIRMLTDLAAGPGGAKRTEETLRASTRVAVVRANVPSAPARAEPSVTPTALPNLLQRQGPPNPEPAAPPGSAKPRTAGAQSVQTGQGSGAALPVTGPKFSREDLHVHASGQISKLFGAAFAPQDGYRRQVRMPEPPLLLADRVTGIHGVAGSMGKGTIWTETDVCDDSWYLHAGRMPAGIMIEAGQADLMLISWLGVDLLNRGERVYRLLGCELTYHGELPRPGDTLAYDIHVDGHAKQGETRLFFFHYDCRIDGKLVLSVRNGQAGFFTDEELRNSAGVLWDVATAAPDPGGSLDAPHAVCTKRSFEQQDLRAFSEGRVYDCFGPGFERACAHVATPRIASERMLLLERVTEFAPRGGAWGRGYLRAELPISPDAWFFKGHFKNDPCMPGTLMFEGCLQAMAFFITAVGYTLDRDGYRFEPMPEQRSTMRCRGQVSPSSQSLVYEVFVSEVSAGPIPLLKADLLCTVDGLKAFHAQGVGLRLVPDWPLEYWERNQAAEPARGHGAPLSLARLGGLRGHAEPKQVAEHQGFRFDYASLLACAWGRPTRAFGPFYAPFDSPRRVARLPGPPYHFMSRVLRTEREMGQMQAGAAVEVEYDVPGAVWYFDDNGSETMPFCVLMEAALQPCGWLASYVGSTLALDTDLMFRNLDGTATLSGEIRPGAKTLTTKARLSSVSRSGEMIIEAFEVECALDGEPVYQMKTVFGFFPKAAFENQSGLPVSDHERARIAKPGSYALDLRDRPARYFAQEPRLAGGMLCMLDRVSAFEPEGGKNKLGWARAEKDVDPSEWFFKAHFFQDPVQPGSLGIEAFCQLLQFTMRELGMAEGVERPRFEPVAIGRPVTWKYRGQIVPTNRKITSEVEILQRGSDDRGRYVLADAALWVDGKRIYQAKGIGMRIVSELPRSVRSASDAGDPTPSGEKLDSTTEEVLDPLTDTWLLDHCPTWTMPALPMMSMVDRLAGAATRHQSGQVLGVSDVRVLRWLPFPGGPVRCRTHVKDLGEQVEVTLSAFRSARDAALSRFEPVAVGTVRVGSAYAPAPEPWPPLSNAALEPDPYVSGALFHGPAFQLLTALYLGESGASAWLEIERDAVPVGTLRQGLLDAITHAIPHTALHRWSSEIPADKVAYPYRVRTMELYRPLPARGCARLEARFVGFDGDTRFPMIDLQLIADERVCLSMRLVEILLPKGPIGMAPSHERRAFLRDRAFIPGIGLSELRPDSTRLTQAALRESDWLPGNAARIYGAMSGAPLLEHVAIKDHVAQRAGVHPATVVPGADLRSATTAQRPLQRRPLALERTSDAVMVRDAGPPVLDLTLVQAYWRKHFAIGPWPAEDLYYALAESFIGDVVLSDPEAFSRVRGRSVLYLANHQVGVESLMFSVLLPALSGSVIMTLAKAEHRTSWLGQLIKHCFSYPGVTDPGMITFFQRDDHSALLEILQQIGAEMRAQKSAMIHVEGTRALRSGAPVVKMSSAVLELAMSLDCPIVPVRFVGGLPRAELPRRLEFPIGYGRQEVWLGRPIAPEQLRVLPLKERKQVVIDAINQLGPNLADEAPGTPNSELEERVARWMARTAAREEHAVLLSVMQSRAPASGLIGALLAAVDSGWLRVGEGAEHRWLAGLARDLFGPRGPRITRE